MTQSPPETLFSEDRNGIHQHSSYRKSAPLNGHAVILTESFLTLKPAGSLEKGRRIRVNRATLGPRRIGLDPFSGF